MTAKTRNRDWLLDNLIERLPNADFAVVLSTDGLLLGRARPWRSRTPNDSPRSDLPSMLSLEATERISTSAGIPDRCGLDQAMLFIAAGDNTCSALLIGETANMGTVAYEMNQTGQRVGAHLSVDPRPKILDDTGSRRP
ncbi:roadblock/LC7 domain-containing protein [Nocardia gipuzkoensis]